MSLLAFMAATQTLSDGGGGGGFTATGAGYSDGTVGNKLVASSLDLSTSFTLEVWTKNAKEYADFNGTGVWPAFMQRVAQGTGVIVGNGRNGGRAVVDDAVASELSWFGDAPYQAWIHQLLVVDVVAGTAEHYVNGGLANSATGVASLVNAAELRAFVDADDEKWFFGHVRDARVYRRTFTALEAWRRYNENAIKDPAEESYADTVERSYLDAGAVLLDRIGGEDFTLSGGVVWDSGVTMPANPDPLTRCVDSSAAVAQFRLPSATGAVASGGSFVVFGWVKRTQSGNNAIYEQCVTSRPWVSGSDPGITLRLLTTRAIDFAITFDSGNRIKVTTTAVFPTDTWLHIAAEWDGSTNTVKVYVDGVEEAISVGTDTTSGAESIGADIVAIGHDGSSQALKCKICDVGRVDALLTSGDLAALAAGRISDASLAALSAAPTFFVRLSELHDATMAGGTMQAVYGPDWNSLGTGQYITVDSP